MSNQNAGISVSIKDGVHIIQFNNPKKRNAISIPGYEAIKKSLAEAAKNPNIFLTVLTGFGEYYCSGFDVTGNAGTENVEDVLRLKLKPFIGALIDYPKLLIAVVNGPAIGIGVTTLGLCDIVYASDRATFRTPFSNLGLCIEGCASYTFPRILGKSKANELLLVNHEMSAKEAYQFGLVSEIFEHSKLDNLWRKISEYANISRNSILMSKRLMKQFDRAKLHEANNAEVESLCECVMSEDFAYSVIKFMNRKNKSKL